MAGARLTVEQRRTIERWYRIGLSQDQIASIIGKHKSTVSRELARSFSGAGVEVAEGGHGSCWRAGVSAGLRRHAGAPVRRAQGTSAQGPPARPWAVA